MKTSVGTFVAGLLFLVLPVRAQLACGLTQITNTTGEITFNLHAAINAAGNRIAFESSANPLGTNANGNLENFLWDALAGFSQITSTSSGFSFYPSMNAAGSRISFQSDAFPLGSNGDGNFEIFLWDESAGLTQITNTTSGINVSSAINAAGNRIAFASLSDLTGGNSDGNSEIFLWDASTGLTQITNTIGRSSYGPTIDGAGNRIAFVSTADLAGGTGDANGEIFLWDASTGFTQITDTSPMAGNNGPPAISASGNQIAFESNVDGNTEIFLWTATPGITQITNTASGTSVLPAINATGERIVFRSDAPMGSDPGGNLEIYLWDAYTGLTQVTNGLPNEYSEAPAINAAGNRIAFHSNADLVGSNGDRNSEIFLAFCPLSVVEVPAVSPLGLGALVLLLGLAAASAFRRLDTRTW